ARITAYLHRDFFSKAHADHQALPSFPTRRSSDLLNAALHAPHSPLQPDDGRHADRQRRRGDLLVVRLDHLDLVEEHHRYGILPRSEEHTSELQSQSNLVCRLLLEKKKKPKPLSPK